MIINLTEFHAQCDREVPILTAHDEIELAKKRFEICKGCDNSRDNGFACKLHKSCCFGRYRANPANKCPAEPPRWGAK